MLRDLVSDAAGDEVEGEVAGLAVAGDVGGAEVVDEGAAGAGGLGEREPGEGLVGAAEDGVVGELGQDAVVVGVPDQRRPRARKLKLHALHDPVAVQVLARQVRAHSLQRDPVVHPLQPVLRPVVEIVLLHELHGA